MTRAAAAYFRDVLARGSRSFRLASRLLPPGCREDAAVVYAWCRRADDAVDEVPAPEQPAALGRLRAELALVYGDEPPIDVTLRAFQEVVRRRRIPRAYPDELLDGMAMDVAGTRYESLADLLVYCHRVAATVGLMMCHVMDVDARRADALRHAAHLGLAMQLTNICRDVAEDWGRGRLYLPAELLRRHDAGWVGEHLGQALPSSAGAALVGPVKDLLAEAEGYYVSADRGVRALRWRCGLAVRTARLVYAAIGRRIAAAGHDVSRGRAVVGAGRKLALLFRAALGALAALPGVWLGGFRPARLAERVPVRFPDDVLPR